MGLITACSLNQIIHFHSFFYFMRMEIVNVSFTFSFTQLPHFPSGKVLGNILEILVERLKLGFFVFL